nr:hypothetical protein [Tanacetum cinerariifolium]
MTPAAIEEMINRHVEKALETRKANMNIRLGNGNDEGGNRNTLETRKANMNIRLGNGNDEGGNRNSNDNGNRGGNGNGNHNENDKDVRHVIRECTYQAFMKCQPLNFKGTKEVVGLISQKDNRRQQPPFKRQNVRGQNVARAYTAGNNEKRVYNRPLPLCNKCKFHHEGPCTMRCGKCNKQRHYRNNCPKLKDQNRGNKNKNKNRIVEARGKVSMLGGGDGNPDSNVITGCPFNIDLMPVELGSFDVIIGMDWLANHHAVIMCDEKIVQIPYGDEVLIVQIMKKETEDKSKEKRLEDVLTVQNFLEVFPEDFPGLPPHDKLNSKSTWFDVEARKEENYETEDLGGMIKNLEPDVDGTLCLRNKVRYLILVT